MKRYLLPFAFLTLLFTACKQDNAAVDGGSETPPPPVRPDQDITMIDQFTESLRADTSLEAVERLNDEVPGVSLIRNGFFGQGENYYITEQTVTAFTHQIISFFFQNGTLVYSRHRMMRKRCGGPDQICLSEARQYYKDQELIWSESRNSKFDVEGRTDLLGMEAFTMLDSLTFEVIPNLRESDKLYSNEVVMSRALLEELRQPLSTEEKMLKLE